MLGLIVCTFVADMVIGFTERIRTVSECAGVDLFLLEINVSSLRPSEMQYHMEFHIVESRTNATVETLVPTSNVFDATFGFRENPYYIMETRDLPLGERTISPLLQTAIRNDIIPEETECFTIRIWPVDLSGGHVFFDCNYGYLDVDSYFCEHTICIEDNDGRWLSIAIDFIISFNRTI